MKKRLLITILLISLLLSGCTQLSDTQKELKTCIDLLITGETSDSCDTNTRNQLVVSLASEVSDSFDFVDQQIEVTYSNFIKDYFIYNINFLEISDPIMSIEDMFDISKQIYKDFDEILDATQVSTVSFQIGLESYVYTSSDVYFNLNIEDSMSNLLIQKDSTLKDVLDTSIINFGKLTLQSLHYTIQLDLDFLEKTYSNITITTKSLDASLNAMDTKTLVQDYLEDQGYQNT